MRICVIQIVIDLNLDDIDLKRMAITELLGHDFTEETFSETHVPEQQRQLRFPIVVTRALPYLFDEPDYPDYAPEFRQCLEICIDDGGHAFEAYALVDEGNIIQYIFRPGERIELLDELQMMRMATRQFNIFGQEGLS